MARTGPTPWTRRLVARRSGGRCEFRACGAEAVHVHHRFERGMGGIGPKSPAWGWVNKPGNLLHACAYHNEWASNMRPIEAADIGWIINDPSTPACDIPALTVHDSIPVYLDDHGMWESYERRAQRDLT
jgi:hypothetical protein